MWRASGRWGAGWVFGAALAGACGGSSASGAHGSAGASAAGAFTQEGGSSGAGATGDAAGGGAKANGGASGSSSGAEALGGAGAAQGGGAGGAVENMFVVQLSLGQGGGPPRCFPRTLPSGLPGSAQDGQVSCFVAELKPGSCDCAKTARVPLPAASFTAAVKVLAASGTCGGLSGVSCDSLCGCGIVQATGTASDQSSELYACQNELTPAASVNGFCFIDQTRTDASGAPAPLGNPAIVAECPSSDPRLLRFVGAASPASGASVLLGCSGNGL